MVEVLLEDVTLLLLLGLVAGPIEHKKNRARRRGFLKRCFAVLSPGGL